MESGAEAGKAIGERRREQLSAFRAQQAAATNDYLYDTYGNGGAWTDAQHLMWLHDRLIKVHGENPLMDYMWRLREIIERLRLDEPVEPGCQI